MSASEKLKALAFQPIVYTDGAFNFRESFSEESLRPLFNALPQIIAVVESAERVRRIANEVPHQGVIFTVLDPALSALDEALSPAGGNE